MYGRGDGIIRWWMDGVLVGNYTNVKFPNDNGFVEYQISPTWGGNTGDIKTETRLLLVRPQLSEQKWRHSNAFEFHSDFVTLVSSVFDQRCEPSTVPKRAL